MRRRRCDPCPLREDHELRHGCRTHLLPNAPAMDLDRPLGCAELRSNLFVEHAGNYAFEHVKLAWCECCKSITHLLCAASAGATARTTARAPVSRHSGDFRPGRVSADNRLRQLSSPAHN